MLSTKKEEPSASRNNEQNEHSRDNSKNSRKNEFIIHSTRERKKSSEDLGSAHPTTPGIMENSINTPESNKMSEMAMIPEQQVTILSKEDNEPA